ncbi:hypothetical protein OPV22_007551 [Ensete ventricosum]|uniref:Uncharacterized protein n=1 Tax=Ensete ventricosum TaxID=4639 RepID=A0AAV8RHI2_ENSVE|nr:hypothetical protein OPV22_007551 [Ensete ventricosum]
MHQGTCKILGFVVVDGIPDERMLSPTTIVYDSLVRTFGIGIGIGIGLIHGNLRQSWQISERSGFQGGEGGLEETARIAGFCKEGANDARHRSPDVIAVLLSKGNAFFSACGHLPYPPCNLSRLMSWVLTLICHSNFADELLITYL